MSTHPTTPPVKTTGTAKLSISKPKSKSKSRQRKRRNSNNSNASIISIDPVSLKSLRAFKAKMAKESMKQQAIYMQQKQSKFADYTKRYIATELKEEDEINKKPTKKEYSATHIGKHKAVYPSDLYDSSSSKDTPGSVDSASGLQLEDITVEELLPLIKNLVDRHNKLQQEYDNLTREFREQRIVFEDKISELEQCDISFEDMNIIETNMTRSSGKGGSQSRNSGDASNLKHFRQEYEDKIEHLKNNYENNLLSMQSQYEQEIETQKKEIHTLTKDLNDADKENDALRQTLEALEHENQSLRISINQNNKQFQNIKLYQNKNKSLLLENETLKQQIEALEHEMDCIIQEQEQQEEDINNNNYLNQTVMGTKSNPNQRPQTPTHAHTRTVMIGGTNRYSDGRDSSVGGDDLMHQIGDEMNSMNQSSVDPPFDRESNDGDDQTLVEYEDDEKRINDDVRGSGSHGSRNTIANLSKFKKIGAMDPDSMATIMALLEQKEKKRLQSSHGMHSQSQDVVDNFSVESNYSDSQQKLDEQIDGIEDDIRELKDMVLSLMDSTNNIQPSINANLGPIIRKINRMYVMLSGPMESRTSQLDDSGSVVSGYGRRYDVERPHSEHSLNTKSSGDHAAHSQSWVALIAPIVNEWMPSIGFSAIILSTMYLLMRYHRGRFIGIGPPRVLRNKRK